MLEPGGKNTVIDQSVGVGLKLLKQNHFLMLPTLGENFGYVILEALAAGSPVLIGDQTIWTKIDERRAGWSMSVGNPTLWTQTIARCLALDQREFSEMSENARRLANEWLEDGSVEAATLAVLEKALKS